MTLPFQKPPAPPRRNIARRLRQICLPDRAPASKVEALPCEKIAAFQRAILVPKEIDSPEWKEMRRLFTYFPESSEVEVVEALPLIIHFIVCASRHPQKIEQQSPGVKQSNYVVTQQEF